MSERPAQAELQSAIRKLEQLGDYQTYFGNKPDTVVVDAKIPHYQEYNYLHNLVTTTQLLADHYNDTAWLESHKVTNQTFTDALIEMQHAYRGCSLIFGVDHGKNEVPTTSSTPNASSSNQTITVPTDTAQSTTTANTNKNSTTPGEKSNISVKAETFTPVAATQPTPSATANTDAKTSENDAADNTEVEANTITNEIAIPATGNVDTSSRQVSWPALIAVVITGAVIASIAIAVIIRHEPRRTTAHVARSRRRY